MTISAATFNELGISDGVIASGWKQLAHEGPADLHMLEGRKGIYVKLNDDVQNFSFFMDFGFNFFFFPNIF